MSPKVRRLSRLPKAPLVEVVFELRWELQPGPADQPLLRSDPGLVPMMDSFTSKIKKAGYGIFKDMSHPLETGAYGVSRRFFKSADKPFPIMQVGPGIFATNESSEYEWSAFKAQIVTGLRVLLEAYPKLGFFEMKPNYLEIRYVDVFGKSLFGKAALLHFVNTATTLKFTLPPILENRKIFAGDGEGRFVLKRDLREWEKSLFTLDIGSAKNKESGEDVVRMETKVASKDSGVPRPRSRGQLVGAVGDWLEFAHSITSPFFKQFVLPHMMAKFEG